MHKRDVSREAVSAMVEHEGLYEQKMVSLRPAIHAYKTGQASRHEGTWLPFCGAGSRCSVYRMKKLIGCVRETASGRMK